MNKKLLLAVVAFLPGLAAHAALPQQMNYQGRMLTSAGAPVPDAFNNAAIFKIYSVPSGGSALWSESRTGITTTAGLFNVVLGEVTPINILFDVDYWLGIAFNGDPEMAPRQKLTTAPYAFRAKYLEAPASIAGTTGPVLMVQNTGTGIGVTSQTSDPASAAFAGQNTASTGSGFGVYGNSQSTAGTGVYGLMNVAGNSGLGMLASNGGAGNTGAGLRATNVSASGAGLLADNQGGGWAMVVSGNARFDGLGNTATFFSYVSFVAGTNLTVTPPLLFSVSANTPVLAGDNLGVGVGVSGSSSSNYGVFGRAFSGAAAGVMGFHAAGGKGVYGLNTNGGGGWGVYGEQTSTGWGVYGKSPGAGVGADGGAVGISATASALNGVAGLFMSDIANVSAGHQKGLSATADSIGATAVAAIAAFGNAIYARNNGGGGFVSTIQAEASGTNHAVRGVNTGTGAMGALGGTGVTSYFNSSAGVQGFAGTSPGSPGVWGLSENGQGVRGSGLTGVAGVVTATGQTALLGEAGSNLNALALHTFGNAIFDGAPNSVTFNTYVAFLGGTNLGGGAPLSLSLNSVASSPLYTYNPSGAGALFTGLTGTVISSSGLGLSITSSGGLSNLLYGRAGTAKPVAVLINDNNNTDSAGLSVSAKSSAAPAIYAENRAVNGVAVDAEAGQGNFGIGLLGRTGTINPQSIGVFGVFGTGAPTYLNGGLGGGGIGVLGYNAMGTDSVGVQGEAWTGYGVVGRVGSASGYGMAAIGQTFGISATAAAANGVAGFFEGPRGIVARGSQLALSVTATAPNAPSAYFGGSMGYPQAQVQVVNSANGYALSADSGAAGGPGIHATGSPAIRTDAFFGGGTGIDVNAGGAGSTGVNVLADMGVNASGTVYGISATASNATANAIFASANTSTYGIQSQNFGSGPAMAGLNASLGGTGVYGQLSTTANTGAAVHGVDLGAMNTGSAVKGQNSSSLGIGVLAMNTSTIGAASPGAALYVSGSAKFSGELISSAPASTWTITALGGPAGQVRASISGSPTNAIVVNNAMCSTNSVVIISWVGFTMTNAWEVTVGSGTFSINITSGNAFNINQGFNYLILN